MELAARRHGVVTAAELHAVGLSRHAIAWRVDRGWLTRAHRGVYLVGAVRSGWALEAAALAACGDCSLSHASAGALAGIRERHDELVHVSTTRTAARRHAGVRVHRVQRLAADEVMVREGLRVTTVERTVLDLAGVLPGEDLERAVNEALVLRLVTVPGLLAYVARAGPRRGAARLRALLHDHRGITRSEAEEALQHLIARAGLPQPRTNVRVAGYEVDCHWPELGLVVEVDSSTFHGTPGAFQADRAKEAALNAAGQRLLRVTRWETARRPEATVARLAVATSVRPP